MKKKTNWGVEEEEEEENNQQQRIYYIRTCTSLTHQHSHTEHSTITVLTIKTRCGGRQKKNLLFNSKKIKIMKNVQQ